MITVREIELLMENRKLKDEIHALKQKEVSSLFTSDPEVIEAPFDFVDIELRRVASLSSYVELDRRHCIAWAFDGKDRYEFSYFIDSSITDGLDEYIRKLGKMHEMMVGKLAKDLREKYETTELKFSKQ